MFILHALIELLREETVIVEKAVTLSIKLLQRYRGYTRRSL